MGCLRNIIRSIILTLAVTGFIAIGGKDWVMPIISGFFNPSQEKMIENAKKVGDFSKESEEFELEKAAGIMGYNAVVAQHKASGQKFFVVDSGKKEILTQQDLQSPDIENKLKDSVKKIKYQSISAEKLTVTKKGTMSSYGQNNVPYVKFDAKVSKLPIGDVTGIIAVVNDKNGKPRTLLSVNEKQKFSQLIAEEFFKNIK